MVESLVLSVRAWAPGRGAIPRAEFLDRLSIESADHAEVHDGSGCARVSLLSLSVADFTHVDTSADAGAQSEAFAAALREGMLKAAAWLKRQSPDVFADLRAAGRKTDVFIGGWMTQDQFDLDLPAEFLGACAALGLGVQICTND